MCGYTDAPACVGPWARVRRHRYSMRKQSGGDGASLARGAGGMIWHFGEKMFPAFATIFGLDPAVGQVPKP